jgi:hypothetical protein
VSNHRESLIEEAEAYQRDGMSLPLDLISALMAEGIDHTQFNIHYREDDDAGDDNNNDSKEIHNVD